MDLVLVVEDDPSNMRLAQLMLASSFNLATAYSLSEALVVIREEKPTAILVDLKLPDSFGLDTVRHIRAACPDTTAVVVYTGSVEESQEEAALLAGADAFVGKGSGCSYEPVVQALLQSITKRRYQPVNGRLDAMERILQEKPPNTR